ncbi:MAG: hypothetical protein L0Z55_06310 [Planctomycetes bacterium]|nr:hypothetical protein [Planctomycetota bacterium]
MHLFLNPATGQYLVELHGRWFALEYFESETDAGYRLESSAEPSPLAVAPATMRLIWEDTGWSEARLAGAIASCPLEAHA